MKEGFSCNYATMKFLGNLLHFLVVGETENRLVQDFLQLVDLKF